MSWAEERATRIKTAQAEDATRTATLLEARTIVANHADQLWETLVFHLESDTKEFAAALPLAKEKDLQALRLNQNNITIMTRAFPLIKFEIIYQRGVSITGVLQETYSGLGETRTCKLNRIGFTADSKLQPCFTDGERYLHPKQVAEELMERVAEFFEKASKMPSFL
jgi:hypothetical protein